MSATWAGEGYHYKIDLNKVDNDQLQVRLTVPDAARQQTTIKFHIPKIIPGTYAIYDFGKYATNLKAFDAEGNPLNVEKPKDPNTWIIQDAKKLHTITYTIEDTWDTETVQPYSGDFVFEPAGTNFEADTNFVFNINGVCGYLAGMERLPFRVEFDRPKDFYGATSLERTGGDEDTDIFYAPNYMDLQDSPIMFSRPDTAMIQVANAQVLIATYAQNGKVTAKDIAKEVAPILQAQKEYLGGKLPVDRYAFIIYLSENTQSGNFGALEHSYSSLYFLPEGEPNQIAQMVRDVAAHEFFHIVTPLNIHSKEIQYFDYINPKMSQHLWMYEGVTEYSAGHVQVKYGLISVEDYLEVLEEKMRGADQYKQNLPFTTMSRFCLHEHKDQYSNVYQKGALIGMCVDIIALKSSKGERGIQYMMQELSKLYGKETPFDDDELFNEIGKISGKKVKKFLKKYVAGPKELPLAKTFKTVGVNYYPQKEKLVFSPIGGLSQKNIGFNGKNFIISSMDGLDNFATQKIGFRKDDVILKWNGTSLFITNINDVIGGYIQNVELGDDLTITVLRNGEEVQLTTKVQKVKKMVKHVLELDPNASGKAIQLRNAWLGDYKTAAELAVE